MSNKHFAGCGGTTPEGLIYDESGFVVGKASGGIKNINTEDYTHKNMDAMNDQLRKAFITKDSGKRHEEITGAVRDTNEGKGRFDLIAPLPLRRLAELYQRGAKKYGDNNWKKGIKLSRYIDSAMRHLNDYLQGDRSEDHIIACAWNCFSFVATEDAINRGKIPQELNDMGGN